MHLPETNPWNKATWPGLGQILYSWSHETEAHGMTMREGVVTRIWNTDYVQAKYKCPLAEICKGREVGCCQWELSRKISGIWAQKWERGVYQASTVTCSVIDSKRKTPLIVFAIQPPGMSSYILVTVMLWPSNRHQTLSFISASTKI